MKLLKAYSLPDSLEEVFQGGPKIIEMERETEIYVKGSSFRGKLKKTTSASLGDYHPNTIKIFA